MKHVTIGARLAAGFAVILVLLAAVALLGLDRMQRIEDNLQHIVEENNVQIHLATELRSAADRISIATRNAILLDEPEAVAGEVAAITAARDHYAQAYRRLVDMGQGSSPGSSELEALRKVQSLEARSRPLTDEVLAAARNGHDAQAVTLVMQQVRPAQEEWLEAIAALVAHEEAATDTVAQQAEASFHLARLVVIALSIAALAAGGLLAWLTARSITRPIHAAVQVAQTVAAGDLTAEIIVDRRDETGQLLASLKEMNGRLATVVSQVRRGSDNISTAAEQIAVGNLDLSQRTEEQASNLQQTAASMEEISHTVRQNADTSSAAARLAETASVGAEHGGRVVHRVVGTMQEISAASERVVDIISVIDGIAFQTNILALNAAVEAARAGDQGRGFAVVASEVRELALRSATAAKEIKALIESSTSKVRTGAGLVAEAGQAIDDVVGQVREVSLMIREISRASGEQSLGVGQIGDAVQQLDHVTQQNAALVEESAAAADSLRHQTRVLVETVGVFKLREPRA